MFFFTFKNVNSSSNNESGVPESEYPDIGLTNELEAVITTDEISKVILNKTTNCKSNELYYFANEYIKTTKSVFTCVCQTF